MKQFLVALSVIVIFSHCENSAPDKGFPSPKNLGDAKYQSDITSLMDSATYRDKILGMLVGSAIGDAMGAPVEMWSREYINIQFGYVDTILAVTREGSPEGPWEDNLEPGSTTDDTRWKYLTSWFLITQGEMSLDAKSFAQYIIDLYLQEKDEAQQTESFNPEPLERELMHVTWLQEWAKVAKPFVENDLEGYAYAVNRFYGGDLACAGMLYSPVIGGYYPGYPAKAYEEAYKLGLFDLGYARDIMAVSAAYVSKAMEPDASLDDIVNITATVDPLRYANSRLIGRLSHRAVMRSREIQFAVDNMDEDEIGEDMKLARGFNGSRLEYARLMKAYEMLEENLQDIPFHASEIHQINVMALIYSKGDFRKAMEFVVNFGRDNDTVGAVTGAILGAYLGYSGLPQPLADIVKNVSKDAIGIDLEELTDQWITARLGG